MYSQIVSDLEKASMPVKELRGAGVVAITLAAGRIVALAFARDEPNLLWTHPDLGATDLVTANPAQLVGGSCEPSVLVDRSPEGPRRCRTVSHASVVRAAPIATTVP